MSCLEKAEGRQDALDHNKKGRKRVGEGDQNKCRECPGTLSLHFGQSGLGPMLTLGGRERDCRDDRDGEEGIEVGLSICMASAGG